MHSTILHLLVADGCFILFQMSVSKNVLCFLLYFYAAKSLQSCPADNQQNWGMEFMVSLQSTSTAGQYQ